MMKRRGKILAVGCMVMLMAAPATVYGAEQTGLQISANTAPAVGAAKSAYENVAVSRVSNYVNVRTEPNTTSSIVGKIYNNCAATILETVSGEGGNWYKIQSGTVQGYIKSEYFITGSEAEKIAKEIGTVFVKINTQTLRLREEASTDSKTLTLLSQDAEYIELQMTGDFVEIQVDESLSGYVHKDYVIERVEFDTAVSVEEEKQQQDEAERLKKEADEAIARVEELKKTVSVETSDQTASEKSSAASPTQSTMESIGLIQKNPNESDDGPTAAAPNVTVNPVTEKENTSSGTEASNETASASQTVTQKNYGPGYEDSGSDNSESSQTVSPLTGTTSAELTSATRTAIVAYAKQFLGNPYVYGGTSLTNGADCSGFTMKIFEHFGISTGRSSRDQAAKGKSVSLSDIQPGDLLFYESNGTINHVALYIGGGQIIHASTAKTGITISTAYYRTPCKAVTFLE